MSTAVMVTLIICLTLIILFGTVMIAGTVISKNKQQQQDNETGRSTGPHIQYTAKDDAIDGIQDQPKYGQRRKDGKY